MSSLGNNTSLLFYGFTALVLYTFTISIGIIKAHIDSRRSIDYFIKIKEIVEEIICLITEEETKVGTEKKNEKVTIKVLREDKEGHENKLTLSQLLTKEPKEENYEEVISLLTELARKTYKDYKFLIAKSTDEKHEANFLQIVSNWAESPKLHKLIFSKSIDYGIDMQVLQRKFAEKVEKGEVLDLGDEVVVITDDGTGQLPTGVSPINSGLEGGEIAFIISFIKKENFADWVSNNFPKEDSNEQ